MCKKARVIYEDIVKKQYIGYCMDFPLNYVISKRKPAQ